MTRLTRYLLLLSSALALIHLVKANSDICKDKAAAKKAILCVGMLKDSLLMVTKPDSNYEQLVYELPLNSINGSMDKLYISETKPMTVKEKWPVLAESYLYTNITLNKYTYNSFVARDSSADYFLLTTKKSVDFPGLVYDIKNGKVFRGLVYPDDGDNPRQVLISSHQLNRFYAIHKAPNNGLAITRYHWAQDTVVKSCEQQSDIIVPDENKWYPICKVNNQSLMVYHEDKNSTISCDPMLWTEDEDMLKGFVTKDKFYLFGDNYIFILPSEFYEEPNIAHPYEQVEYANFIECSGIVVDSKSSGLGIGVIIAIILGVLVGILIICLLCFREVKRRKHKKKHHKKPDQVSAVADAQSVRSSHMSNVCDGKLSAMPVPADGGQSMAGDMVTGRSGLSNAGGSQHSNAVSNALTGRSGASTVSGAGGGGQNHSIAASNMVTGRSGASAVSGAGASSNAHSNMVTGRSGASAVSGAGGGSKANSAMSNAGTGRSGASATSTSQMVSTQASGLSKQATQRSHQP